MKRIAIYSYRLLPALAALLLTSCVNDNEHCTPDADGRNGITLNLRIAAGNISARTRSLGHDRTEFGTDAENFIDIQNEDFCVFLLDDEPTDQARIVQRYTPQLIELEQEGQKTVYKMSATITPFTQKFRVMVVANWQTEAFGGRYDDLVLERTSLNELYDQFISPTFVQQPAVDTSDPQKIVSWVPDAEKGVGIPMFGLSQMLDTRTAKASVLDDVQIPMLRSLAKIVIVNATNDENLVIEACRLSSYNRRGRFVPDGRANPDWFDEKTQVTVPSIPFVIDNNHMPAQNLFFVPSEDGKQFAVYIPEMDFTRTTAPHIDVDMSINGTRATYDIQLKKYNTDGKPDPNPENAYRALLRNHRYRFNIKSVEQGVGANLTLIVDSDWDTFDSEFDYRDAAAVFEDGKHFTWTTSTFEENGLYDKRTLLVDPTGGAEASFTMTEPKLGTWTLALYGSDDTHNDAFRIEIWDDETNDGDGGWNTREGESPDAITRPVDGKEVKIRIVATGSSDSAISYTARLVMTVKTFDDRIAEVNLPHAEDNPMLRPTIENNGYYFVKQTKSGL